MSKIPILFLGYNRPEETTKSFQCIRNYAPSKLYIALDGPRNSKEKLKCEKVKEIVSKLDWDCEAKFLIRESNLGCKNSVNNAIDWFFEHEDMGIIYEDDILAESDFFEFVGQMLQHYKNDERVWLVTGNNLLGKWGQSSSYFFSKIGAIWGWGTWRRAWLKHDKGMSAWPEIKRANAIFNILQEDLAEERNLIFDKVYSGEIDTWDYQFTFTRLINSGLSIVPSVNLIKNIGFNSNATHTRQNPDNLFNEILNLVFPVKHPVGFFADSDFDFKIYLNRVKQHNRRSKSLRIFKKIVSNG